MGAKAHARRLGLFAFVFLVYALSPVGTAGDSRWTVPLARSIVRDGDVNLREVAPAIAAADYYAVGCFDRTWQYPATACPSGELRYYYPVALSVIAAPVVAVFDAVVGAGRPTNVTEILTASVFAAAAAVVMMEIGLLTLPWPKALAFALVFAFATPMWSVATRALWQHGPSALCNALVLWLVLRRGSSLAMGALMALAYFLRPTNVVPELLLVGWLVMERRQRVWPLFVGAGAVGLVFVSLSWMNYGTLLEPYFSPKRLGGSVSIAAVAAYLISPGRGIFVFMPYLLLAMRGWTRFEGLMGATVGVQVLLYAAQPDWYGGASYGPRYLTDVLPHLFVLFLPAMQWRAAPLILVAVLIHGRGATSMAVHEWSKTPVDVNAAPERLWDWRDPSFLR